MDNPREVEVDEDGLLHGTCKQHRKNWTTSHQGSPEMERTPLAKDRRTPRMDGSSLHCYVFFYVLFCFTSLLYSSVQPSFLPLNLMYTTPMPYTTLHPTHIYTSHIKALPPAKPPQHFTPTFDGPGHRHGPSHLGGWAQIRSKVF